MRPGNGPEVLHHVPKVNRRSPFRPPTLPTPALPPCRNSPLMACAARRYAASSPASSCTPHRGQAPPGIVQAHLVKLEDLSAWHTARKVFEHSFIQNHRPVSQIGTCLHQRVIAGGEQVITQKTASASKPSNPASFSWRNCASTHRQHGCAFAARCGRICSASALPETPGICMSVKTTAGLKTPSLSAVNASSPDAKLSTAKPACIAIKVRTSRHGSSSSTIDHVPFASHLLRPFAASIRLALSATSMSPHRTSNSLQREVDAKEPPRRFHSQPPRESSRVSNMEDGPAPCAFDAPKPAPPRMMRTSSARPRARKPESAHEVSSSHGRSPRPAQRGKPFDCAAAQRVPLRP